MTHTLVAYMPHTFAFPCVSRNSWRWWSMLYCVYMHIKPPNKMYGATCRESQQMDKQSNHQWKSSAWHVIKSNLIHKECLFHYSSKRFDMDVFLCKSKFRSDWWLDPITNKCKLLIWTPVIGNYRTISTRPRKGEREGQEFVQICQVVLDDWRDREQVTNIQPVSKP